MTRSSSSSSIRRCNSGGTPAGFSLVELVVALLILSMALVALTGSALLAQRSLEEAAAAEAATRAVSLVADSLMAESTPGPGTRQVDHVEVAWTVAEDDGIETFAVSARVAHPPSGRVFRFSVARFQSPPSRP
jgi:prepilin-type N-terminal cleavage/methylation domain-containing protein